MISENAIHAILYLCGDSIINLTSFPVDCVCLPFKRKPGFSLTQLTIQTWVQSFILPSQCTLFAVLRDESVRRLSSHGGLFMVRMAAILKGCYGYPHTRYSAELRMVVMTSHAYLASLSSHKSHFGWSLLVSAIRKQQQQTKWNHGWIFLVP